MRIVGGADTLFWNAEAVPVQLAAAAFVVNDGNRVGAVWNILENIAVRLPYLVQPASSVSIFHLSGKTELVIEKRDAEIADAIVGVEHIDHDAASFDGRGFIRGWRVCKKVHGGNAGNRGTRKFLPVM